MLKEEKKYLVSEFNRIISKVPNKNINKLETILERLNSKLDVYDFFVTNWIQNAKRFFMRDARKRMKDFVKDIFDGYDKGKGYKPEHNELIKNTLTEIINEFDNKNKTLLDRVISILGFSCVMT